MSNKSVLFNTTLMNTTQANEENEAELVEMDYYIDIITRYGLSKMHERSLADYEIDQLHLEIELEQALLRKETLEQELEEHEYSQMIQMRLDILQKSIGEVMKIITDSQVEQKIDDINELLSSQNSVLYINANTHEQINFESIEESLEGLADNINNINVEVLNNFKFLIKKLKQCQTFCNTYVTLMNDNKRLLLKSYDKLMTITTDKLEKYKPYIDIIKGMKFP